MCHHRGAVLGVYELGPRVKVLLGVSLQLHTGSEQVLYCTDSGADNPLADSDHLDRYCI
jgi:hypothetical protein